jgi:hypothetical protein
MTRSRPWPARAAWRRPLDGDDAQARHEPPHRAGLGHRGEEATATGGFWPTVIKSP